MINSLYTLGKSALQNAQLSIANASNNISNADTEGYQRTTVDTETSSSITLYGISVGTGADVTSIQSELDSYIEAQYLDASAELARYSSAYEYLYQLDSLLNQTDGGLSETLSDYFTAWSELTTDPDSTSAREDLLGESETLVYAITSTQEQLQSTVDSINSEISDQVDDANTVIQDIADLNAAIVANPDDTQSISERDQLIRELDSLIGVDASYNSDGSVMIMTEEGYTLVDGTETHNLVYGDARVTESISRDSTYTGSLEYSGTSSNEILLEFVSDGADGVAQFKVSLDGGNTWETDDEGNIQLYTAGDADNSVTVDGVEIYFDGTGDHTTGDRYNVMTESGLYWENSSGGLVNITPLTDASGDDISGRTSSGSLAGLFTTRDDTVIPTMDEMDDLAEALIWETNSEHATGAGLEHQDSLTASYGVDDSTTPLSNSGLYFEDKIESGEFELVTYDSDDNVSSYYTISIDPSTDSLDDIVSEINTNFAGELTASITDGQLTIAAASDMSFEVASDTSNLMAALGMNTYFTGTNASDISINSTVATDISHINSGVVSDDYSVASGSNAIATNISALSDETVTVGGSETTLSSAVASMVASVGAATASAELKQTYAETSAEYLYEQQASASEVSIDEELIELTKQQQMYQAAAEIITVTRTMFDTILDMV